MKEPTSTEECIYYTQRTINSGRAKAWVFKELCPKCKKALMGKPKDEKTGKVKIRAKEYVCPECKYTVEKKAYEDTLTCNIKYTCPHCNFQGETQVPYKRKKITRINEETGKKQSIDSIRFTCSKCGKDIDITKKMK